MIDGQLIINPTNSQRDVSDLDLVVAGTREAVAMVEAAANQLSESTMLEAIWLAHARSRRSSRRRSRSSTRCASASPSAGARGLPAARRRRGQARHLRAAQAGADDAGQARPQGGREGGDRARTWPPSPRIRRSTARTVKKVIGGLEEEILRDTVLGERKRFDGRALDEIRPITIEVGLLPRVHGSALFTRGETQALVSATLGHRRDAQIIEEYEGESKQKFLLHYNFPPFSVGEVRFLRGPGRREIGHGVLARRALTPLLPAEDQFAYTVRVVSDILESNGSSSMATVCGGSLALFDAGVPMAAPVAGVAMGLIKRDDQFAVLTDIAGAEDHYGDMDFKVAGTRDGVTASRWTSRSPASPGDHGHRPRAGAPRPPAHPRPHGGEAAAAAHRDVEVRAAPHVVEIPVDKIRDIIGPGGKTIRGIVEETGCEIEVENDGKVKIFAPSSAAADRAKEIIERLTEVPEVGKTYTGTVRRIETFGAFVEILPGLDGLLHISELAPYRVGEVRDVLKEGDEVTVKVLDYDEGTGKVRLSRKAIIMESPTTTRPSTRAWVSRLAPARGQRRRWWPRPRRPRRRPWWPGRPRSRWSRGWRPRAAATSHRSDPRSGGRGGACPRPSSFWPGSPDGPRLSRPCRTASKSLDSLPQCGVFSAAPRQWSGSPAGKRNEENEMAAEQIRTQFTKIQEDVTKSAHQVLLAGLGAAALAGEEGTASSTARRPRQEGRDRGEEEGRPGQEAARPAAQEPREDRRQGPGPDRQPPPEARAAPRHAQPGAGRHADRARRRAHPQGREPAEAGAPDGGLSEPIKQ
jgi:polyribonucleotide nucleotidyltransferase